MKIKPFEVPTTTIPEHYKEVLCSWCSGLGHEYSSEREYPKCKGSGLMVTPDFI